MRYRYKAAVTGVTVGTTSANTLWPMLGLPIDNIAKRCAELVSLSICGAAEAPADLAMTLQLGVTTTGNIPAGGTNMPDLGPGAGIPLALDKYNSRVSGVGDNVAVKHTYSAAVVTYARKPGIWTFNHKYPLILTPFELKGITWGPAEALFIEVAHGSGSTAKVLNIDVVWEE